MKSSQLLLFAGLAALPVLAFADSATDRQIESTAESSYNFRTVLNDSVKVRVNDGVATLTGTVMDKDQKVLAEDTVSGISGVTRVRDKIKVKSSGSESSDSWITLKAKTVLLTHANVSATSTTLDVKDGIVTLSGTADSQAQKELTEADIKDIDGVKSVRNDLEVKSSDSSDASSSNSSGKVDDASITAQVKYELLTHRATSAVTTKVETSDGKVLIHGNADNDAEKDLVTKLAKDVRGVESVDNEMTVK